MKSQRKQHSSAFDEANGTRRAGARTSDELPTFPTQGLSLSSAGCYSRGTEPHLGGGYNLCPDAYRVHVPSRHYRLVQPSCDVLAVMDTAFCLDALEQALQRGKPLIFNSDQGVQFTSIVFTGKLKAEAIQISMDGRGRVFDNIFVERLWRTVKYEDIYLKDYASVAEY